MRIAAFEIENFKSFLSTPEIDIPSGFVVIVGKNNVGKTALLQALSLRRLTNSPHRSFKTLPKRNSDIRRRSSIIITFEFSGDDLKEMLYGLNTDLSLPIPESPPPNISSYLREFYRRLDGGNFRVQYTISETLTPMNALLVGFTHPLQAQAGIPIYIYSQEAAERQLSNSQSIQVTSQRSEALIQVKVFTPLVRKVYIFDAERIQLDDDDVRYEPELESDSRNLAQVLHNLSAKNVPRFNRFLNYVKRVFPEITMITTPTKRDTSRIEVRIWDFDPQSERDDLATPLGECGTGIGQVLAMLYIVVTSETPKIILIDEPQSFLHPGAIRRLFEIFKENDQHQYIVTTHSPTVITAADPQTILLVRKDDSESIITPVDMKNSDDANIILREIGARLADVFGADNILWVEGQTEETCFPQILSAISQEPLLGTVIRGVLNTGDFDKRSRELTLQIYRRLSEGSGILPPAIGFIFDRERQSEAYVEELKKVSDGKVYFLERRMFENYLLDTTALAFLMSTLDNFREPAVSSSEIEAWIEQVRWETKYIDSTPEKTLDYWLKSVDAARLLSDMFSYFSNARYEFQKTAHSVALTEWLIEHKPEKLKDVADLIVIALGRGQASD